MRLNILIIIFYFPKKMSFTFFFKKKRKIVEKQEHAYMAIFRARIKIFPFLFPIRGYYECTRKTGFYQPFPHWVISAKIKRVFIFLFFFFTINPGQKTCTTAMITNLRKKYFMIVPGPKRNTTRNKLFFFSFLHPNTSFRGLSQFIERKHIFLERVSIRNLFFFRFNLL